MPILCVMPTSQSIVTTQPLFLPYTQSGPEHYDAVVSTTEIYLKCIPTTQKCNCGRKPNFKGDSCLSIRCKCFRERNACTYFCRCKSCKNKYGTRPPTSTIRRRKSYDEQRQPLRGKTTGSFLISKSEDIDKGNLTLLEDLLLKGIIVYFIVGLQITARNVFLVYKAIYRMCQLCDSVNFPLFECSEKCVNHFLLQIFHILELLKSLLK